MTHSALPSSLPRPPDELAKLEAIWRTPTGWRFFTTVNNNNIGLLYIGTALLFFVLAGYYNVPLQLSPIAALACLLLSMTLALVSGLAAIRTLRHADPASLLR